MAVPTQGEEFSKLTHFIREAQESSARLAHLTRSMSNSSKDSAIADGWIALSEMFKRINFQIIQLAKGKLQ